MVDKEYLGDRLEELVEAGHNFKQFIDLYYDDIMEWYDCNMGDYDAYEPEPWVNEVEQEMEDLSKTYQSKFDHLIQYIVENSK